ncbi:strawberry notch C-terminal domain-containing protein [Acidibrevibacterium fodinaquatile]|nr:strawberry notch C-terminal domain-containing protein [Acidibrevibacterium fodinaquatile]
MEQKINELKRRALHNADAAYYVLDYLAHGFPTQLFEIFTDSEGNLLSRPVFRDGQPVQSREAVERRDRMIEHLAALPAVQGALDQIVQRFGTDQVAEVTGRSRRVVRKVARCRIRSQQSFDGDHNRAPLSRAFAGTPKIRTCDVVI